MKKLFNIICVVLLVFSLCFSSCNSRTDNPSNNDNTEPQINKDFDDLHYGNFEVYSDLKMDDSDKTAKTYTLSTNQLEIAMKNTDLTNVSVFLVDGDEKEELKFSIKNKSIIIDGNEFGSSIYGEKGILIKVGDKEKKVNVNIVTKFIEDGTDLVHLQRYGDLQSEVKNDASGLTYEYYTYDGYFLMTKNISFGYTAFNFIKEGTTYYNYPQKVYPSFEDIGKVNNYFGYEFLKNTGFVGVFDGQGYTIYCGTPTEVSWVGSGYNSCGYPGQFGIFGNVAESGVVKNLGVRARLQSKALNFVFGASFAGTLENCYINIQALEKCAVPFAWYSGYAKLKDVVIFNDTTNVSDTIDNISLLSYFAGAKDNNGEFIPQSITNLDNVYFFVGDNVDQSKISVLGGDYEEELALTLNLYSILDINNGFEPKDMQYWDLTSERPMFISTKEVIDSLRKL